MFDTKERKKSFFGNIKVLYSLDTLKTMNQKCEMNHLISFFTVATQRAYLHSTLGYLLAYYMVINDLSKLVGTDHLMQNIGTLASISLLCYFIAIVSCTLFCFMFIKIFYLTIYQEVHLNKEHEHLGKIYKYIMFNKSIENTLKNWHILGVIYYPIIGLLCLVIFFKLLAFSSPIEFYMSDVYLTITKTCIGSFILGGFWNLSDYYFDKAIDWSVIIKGLMPIFDKKLDVYKMRDSCEKSSVLNLIEKKFKALKCCVFKLLFVSTIHVFVILVMFVKVNDFLKMELDVFNNVHVLFMIGICYLFYNSCYIKFFAKQDGKASIIPHITDFRASKDQ